jgi:hypothetical protein
MHLEAPVRAYRDLLVSGRIRIAGERTLEFFSSRRSIARSLR